MDKEFIPIVSAAIIGGATLSVVFINKIFEFLMWKSNLARKGEEKYLERKIDTLHLTIVDIFELTAETLSLGRLSDEGISMEIKTGLKSVDNTFRKKIANVSPFLNNEIMDNEVSQIYMILASIRELMSRHEKHGNISLSISESRSYQSKEGVTLENAIITHTFWLNEALHDLKDKLVIIMNPLYKPVSKWKNSVLMISIVFNVLLVITLIFSLI